MERGDVPVAIIYVNCGIDKAENKSFSRNVEDRDITFLIFIQKKL